MAIEGRKRRRRRPFSDSFTHPLHYLVVVVADATHLQYVSVPLMTNEKCREFHRPSEVTENMICAGFEKSSCHGDSGKATVKPCK